jgi:hypothetical protein
MLYFKNGKMKNWSKYIIEFVVIIFSVTLSFMVTKCRDNQLEHARNLKFLERIKTDLKADSEGLDLLLKYNNLAIQGTGRLLALIDGMKVERDSIPEYIMYAMYHLPLQLRTANYESIKNSGVIYSFGDSLINTLIRHYDNRYQEIEYYREEIREIEHQKIYPVITSKYDLSAISTFNFRKNSYASTNFTELLNDLRFRNELMMLNFIRVYVSQMANDAKQNIKNINDLIDRELND